MKTHPWINFELDLKKLYTKAWMDLGACSSKCRHICRVPLKPSVAKEMHKIYLAKGAQATTAIEGNTLTEEQVRLRIEKKLELPPSKEYLGQEVDNIIQLCNEITREIKKGELKEMTLERLCYFNKIILKGVPVEPHVVPGEIRKCDVGVGSYKAPSCKDVPDLVEQFCKWLNSQYFEVDKDTPISNSILKAITAHLYMAWIHPFGDGNGRVARILEFAILLSSGVPSPAAHLLSNHYNATRNMYYQHLDQSSKHNDVSGFVSYAIQGFRDGLEEQLKYIFGFIMAISWESYVYEKFDNQKGHEDKKRRQRTLVLELSRKNRPVSRDEIVTLSQKTINAYVSLAPITLDRDLEELDDLGLIEKVKDQYQGKKKKILSFLPIQKKL